MPPLKIDIVSDVVCPWCFIGKRRLESALALYRERRPEAAAPELAWHPFQLNPDLDSAGVPRAEYVAAKFGDRGREIYSRVAAVGREVGIEFAFDRIAMQPNTLNAHRLISRAGAGAEQDALVESLFRAYFLEGSDLTRAETLAQAAADAGQERELALGFLATDTGANEVREAEREARRLGVQGVPFFVFNRKLAVSGAQESKTLVEAMLRSESANGG